METNFPSSNLIHILVMSKMYFKWHLVQIKKEKNIYKNSQSQILK